MFRVAGETRWIDKVTINKFVECSVNSALKFDRFDSYLFCSRPRSGLFHLQVISDYCKTHHQVKPFSHIVMDLFREAANQPERDGDPHHDDIGDADEEQQLNAKVQRLKAANEAEVAEERKLGLHNKNKKQPGDEKYETFLISD